MEKDSDSTEFIDEQAQLEIAAAEYYKPQVESYGDYISFDEGRSVGPEERQSLLQERVRDTIASYQHKREKAELEQSFVPWNSITTENVAALRHELDQAKNEEDLQRFFCNNKLFLIQHLGGGHGRYVIPKPRLGADLIPDFLIAEMSSIGIEWHGVELESPLAIYFTSYGQAASRLTHAVQQIVDWRAWLQSNIAYARTRKSDKGLGLIGIANDLSTTILIGRRTAEIPARFNDYRKQIRTSQNIEIHTYDWLVEQSQLRVQQLGR